MILSKNRNNNIFGFKTIYIISIFLFCLFLNPSNSSAVSNSSEKLIGVLAKRGAIQCLNNWQATAQFLTQKVDGVTFKIVPLAFDEIERAVQNREIDFILANSSIYINLEHYYNVTRIATMKNLIEGKGYTRFGGVIFTRSDSNIKSLEELPGKKFAAVDEKSLGGWRVGLYAMIPFLPNKEKSFKELLFTGTHDSVVVAVRDGVVDAGTVRTDTLERMEREGSIDIKDFKELKSLDCPCYGSAFPFMLSTHLYPEWPIAKLEHVSDQLARRVASALFAMPADSIAAADSLVTGWTIPSNYQPVHNLLKSLKVDPYKDFGKVTLWEAVKQHRGTLAVACVLLAVSLLFAVTFFSLNRRLESSKDIAEKELSMRISEETRRKDVENMVRHELRSPAASISSGMTYLQMDEDLSADQLLLVDEIKKMADRMLHITTLNQEISKMESGRFKLKDGLINIYDIVEKELSLIRNYGESRGITLRTKGFNELSKRPIKGDESLIGIMIRNLISNAVEASPNEKDILITFDSTDSIILSVHNLGSVPVGIREVFFGKYVTKGKSSGTGLGTYLIKLIAENHRGSVFLDASIEGETTVGVVLPILTFDE